MTTPPDPRAMLESLLGVPATEGNQVDVLRNGDEIFPAMLEAIRSAEHTVDFLTFIYWQGDIATEFAHALAERARAGVRTRVLLDAIGSRLMDDAMVAEMSDAGATVCHFRPPNWRVWEMDHRTHRKILVVDESTSFTGGVGIAQEWCGDARHPDEWRDTHFRVRGPAVRGLRAAFATNWVETEEPVSDDRDRFPPTETAGDHTVQVVSGTAAVRSSDIAILIRSLLRLAQRRVRITTPYFSPDPTLADLLCEVADRDVEIDLLLPGPHIDKRFVQLANEDCYPDLMEHGIAIWNYQPTMLHAKVITVDGELAMVGSANVNSRSMAQDAETSMVLFDRGLTEILDGHFEEDLERSERIDPERWERRPARQTVLERTTRLLRPRL